MIDHRDVLLKAASWFEEEGNWCQNAYWRSEDEILGFSTAVEYVQAGVKVSACLMGGVALVGRLLDPDSVVTEDSPPTVSALAAIVDLLPEGVAISSWNDAPARTADEVAALCRKAAE